MSTVTQPFFSIIIPVHNRAKTLPMCIDSILAQSYKNFELILVDDHSTDNSFSVMTEYKAKDNRIICFKQSDKKHGAQAARNTGIKEAKYDWIMFNDSDDVWALDKIQKELNKLKEYKFDNAAIIYSDCNTIDINSGEKKYWALPRISKENSYKDLLGTSGPMFQSLLCSKDLLEKINYLDETVPSYQEWDTSIRLAQNGFFIHIKEPLFDYYIGASDAISKSIQKDFIGRCNIYNKFKNEIVKNYSPEYYKNLLKNQIETFFTFNDKTFLFDNLIFAEFLKNCYMFFPTEFEKTLKSIQAKKQRESVINMIKKLIPQRIKNIIKEILYVRQVRGGGNNISH